MQQWALAANPRYLSVARKINVLWLSVGNPRLKAVGFLLKTPNLITQQDGLLDAYTE